MSARALPRYRDATTGAALPSARARPRADDALTPVQWILAAALALAFLALIWLALVMLP